MSKGISRYSVALRLQVPVGFGGFHVAFLDESLRAPWGRGASAPFVYVYDCGALSTVVACAWARRVGRCIKGQFGQVDLAVLSHVDYDHVCAIDELAANVYIDTLLLPRATLRLRKLQLAALARNKPDWYKRFVADPQGWAKTRGVKRIIQIEARPEPLKVDDREPEPIADNAPAQRPILRLPAGRRIGGAGEVVATSGGAISIQVPNSVETWRLIPIVPSPRLPDECDRALQKLLGTEGCAHVDTADLSRRSSKSLRNRLARIYRRHWGNTNDSSLLMLIARCSMGQNSRGGWLCTGDANLTDTTTMKILREQGRPWLSAVDVVQVPHHGSPKNLDSAGVAEVDKLLGAPPLWIASSGRNRWGYPAPIIRRLLASRLVVVEPSNGMLLF